MPGITHNFDIIANELIGISKIIEKNGTNIVRKMGVGILQSVIYATPHDTGKARANWQVTLKRPTNKQLKKKDKDGGATIAKGERIAIGFKLNDGSIWISNNVPYINRLNNGWSDQAAPGYIERAVENVSFTGGRTPLLR